jgi:regulator of replication initiation timing
MAEKLNLDNYTSFRLNTEHGSNTIDATAKKDIGDVALSFTENQALAAKGHHRSEREWFNFGASSMAKKYGEKLPDDAKLPEMPEYPIAEGELVTRGYPKKAKWNTLHDGTIEATIIGEYQPAAGEEVQFYKLEGVDDKIPAHEVETVGTPEAITEGFPRKAIWKGRDGDQLVTVTGSMGEKDGTVYYAVEGSDTGLPADQLTFKPLEDSAEEKKDTSEGDLAGEIADLKDQLTKMNERLDTLMQENKDLLKENERLKKELEELKSGRVDTMQAGETGPQPKFEKGQAVRVKHKGNIEDGWEVSKDDEPIVVDGKRSYVVKKRSNNGLALVALRREVSEEDLLAWQSEPVTGAETTLQTGEYDYEWDPIPGEYVNVKIGDKYDEGWEITRVYKDENNALRITARKEGQPDKNEPYEVFLMWQVESGNFSNDENDEEETKEEERYKPSKWERLKFYAAPANLIALLASRRGRRGRYSEVTTEEVTEVVEKDRRRGGLGAAAGILAVGAVAGVAAWEYVIEPWLESRHGIPRSGISQHVDLKGINPNTIHAANPTQFEHGVLNLLAQQGVHAEGVTPEKIQHMNHWMEAHNIASGMKDGHSGLEQNLVDFPNPGHEFANVNASADQGFRIGQSGSGREALDRWVREAERAGITFRRTG